MAPTARLTSAGSSGRCQPRFFVPPRKQHGLTIVELVLVIVIIAVLGTLAGPRFFNERSFAERGYAEELASALRYAQKVAVGSGCRVRVDITPGSYQLRQQAPAGGHCDPLDTTFPQAVVLSSGQQASGTAPDGVSVAPAGSIIFDALGRTSLAADLDLLVGPHTVNVQSDSGLIRGPG